MFISIYAPTFLRQLKKIKKKNKALFEEILEKVELLESKNNHQQLKIHNLKGRFLGRKSISVNYKIRIICKFLKSREIHLLDVGGHEIYEK